MKYRLLQNVIPELDIDFLNETSIEFSFRKQKQFSIDNGWCDYTTGSRILTEQDQIIFEIKNSEEELVLQLKFGDRIEWLM